MKAKDDEMVLPNGHSVSRKFFEAVVDHVKEMMLGLPPDCAVSLKVLCGPEFWDRLSPGMQKSAGVIVACLVAHGRLPMRFVGCKHRVPKLYVPD